MPAIAALLTELVAFVSRLFFLFKDLWVVIYYNLRFFGRVLVGFFPWLVDMGNWLWSFFVTLPGHLSEAALVQFAKLINVVLGAASLGFVADALNFPSVIGGIEGLAYFTAPFRVEYGIAVVLSAYSARFLLKLVPHVPIGKFPRLPGARWPQSNGGGQ